MTLGIQFPFEDSNKGGRFKATRTTREAIRSNLTSLMTTMKGQRPMRSNVYSPFYSYLFDPWDNLTEEMLDKEVREVVQDVMPEITLEGLVYDFDEETYVLKVTFIYSIVAFNSIEDKLELSFQFNRTEE